MTTQITLEQAQLALAGLGRYFGPYNGEVEWVTTLHGYITQQHDANRALAERLGVAEALLNMDKSVERIQAKIELREEIKAALAAQREG